MGNLASWTLVLAPYGQTMGSGHHQKAPICVIIWGIEKLTLWTAPFELTSSFLYSLKSRFSVFFEDYNQKGRAVSDSAFSPLHITNRPIS